MRTHRIKTCSIILIFLTIISCHYGHSKKVVRDNIPMLYGEITADLLFAEYPDWKALYDDYIPDTRVLEQMPKNDPDLGVEIFLGTWCEDSRREVPAFLKIADLSGFTAKTNLRLWAVDRKKHLEGGLAQIKNIEMVATFIFLKNGREIGRIVETPENELLETDILQILVRN